MQTQIEAKTLSPRDWPQQVETSELDSRDRELEFRGERENRDNRDERITMEVTGLLVLILVLAAATVWLLNCKVKMQWPFGP